MERAAVVLALVAFLAAWNLFLYKKSDRLPWDPLWMAFTATFAAILFIGTGAAGYILSTPDRFVAGTAWSDSVIWWQVWTGVGVVPVAALLWRRGLRSLRA